MAAVQSVLLEVSPHELQGPKQAPLHRNAHTDLALGRGAVRERNARPLIDVVCRDSRNPCRHGRRDACATQHGEQVHPQAVKRGAQGPPAPLYRVGGSAHAHANDANDANDDLGDHE